MNVKVLFKLLSAVHTWWPIIRSNNNVLFLLNFPYLIPITHSNLDREPAWGKGGVSILGFSPGPGQRAGGTHGRQQQRRLRTRPPARPPLEPTPLDASGVDVLSGELCDIVSEKAGMWWEQSLKESLLYDTRRSTTVLGAPEYLTRS